MEELRGIDVGDRHLERRAVLLAERLAEKPLASIPGACNGWAETPVARDLGHPADWLVRSQHHCALPAGAKWWPAVTAGAALGELRFTLPARAGRKARDVQQQVWAPSVTLPSASIKLPRTTSDDYGKQAVGMLPKRISISVCTWCPSSSRHP